MAKPRRQPPQPATAERAETGAPSEIQPLLDGLVSSDAASREQAHSDLLAMRFNATEPLVAALATKDDRYRWKILMILSEIADRRAAAGVIACLRSSSPAIRIAAAQFLGDIGAAEAVDPLIDILKNNFNDQAAVWVIQALGKLADKRAVPLLVDTMHRTESHAVRYTAIEALAAIGDTGVIREIRQYTTDPSRHVQTRALTALEKLSRV